MKTAKEKAVEYLKRWYVRKDFETLDPVKSILGDKIYTEEVVIKAIDIALQEQEKEFKENLEFMRSAIEKTHREIDPEAFSMIIWGLVCIVVYYGIYFLAIYRRLSWMPYVLFPALAVGGIVGFISSYRVSKRQKAQGMVSHVWKQLNWV